MKVHTSRILIFITIVILILSELLSQVVNLFSILGAILVIFIYAYCAKMARKSGNATIWFLVPTIIFTFIPLVIKFWPEEKPNSILEYILSSLLNNIPLIISFIIPIILLTIVYYGLKKHEEI